MKHKINIAIDGYSSCGKGTLAKMLSKSLSYLFIDTGAMYRAVTLAMIRNDVSVDAHQDIKELLPRLTITFEHNPEKDFYHTLLNGEDVESELRSMEVNELVSPVSRIDEVREFLVAQQRNLGLQKGVVMDGRDIGTVVFPDAELKIFMTAKPEVRATRRFNELISAGNHEVSFQEILDNLNKRDQMDSMRLNSPLKPAEDALILDNSDLSREQQFEIALQWANQRIRKASH
jgi:cytidylate kinase